MGCLKSDMKSEKLERYCDVISGYAFKSTDWRDSGVPVVKIGNISNGTDIIFDEQIQYVEEEFKNKIDSKYLICKGDILLSLTGSHINQPNSMVGRCCRNRQNKLYFLNQRSGKVIPFSSADKSYLYYLLSTKEIKYAIANKAYGGANQVNISPRDIKNIRWTFPRLEIQQRIASILSAYDDLIENNNRRIKILEQMAENLYKEWFVRFRFPGYEQAEFENGIPKGWEYKTIEELSDTLRRGISPTYDPDGKYTVINQKCIRSSILDMSEAQQQSKPYKSELNLQDGDTVICSTGTGTLGRVGQVYGEYKDTTYDSHVTLVRANQVVGRHFLYWSLKELQPWFMNMGIGSTNQQELYRGTIKNAKILVPSNVDLLDAFENYIQDIHCQIGLLRDKNQNLTKQRDKLLPRLMSGKLEV